MKPRPIHFAILLALLTGLVVNNSPTTLAGVTVPACADLSGTSTASVKIAGKVVAPGSLVRVPVGGICGPNEVQVGFNGYARTILVSPVMTATDNGTALLAAMNTASSGYLIKLDPGTYDLGTNQLIMKQGVDLAGSGQDLTFIMLNDNPFPYVSGMVVLTKTSEIRSLTIANNSSVNSSLVTTNGNTDRTTLLTNVTISATTSSGDKYGINGGSAVIKNSRIIISCTNSANCYGINNPSNMVIDASEVDVTASGTGTAYGVKNSSGGITEIINSLVYVRGDNGATSYGISNAGGYSEITNVKITMGCSANCAGILNNGSSPTIINPFIKVSAYFNLSSSTFQTYGISNTNNSNSAIQGGVIQMWVSGGSSNLSNSYGIANNGSSPVIQGMQITITGSSGMLYGIYNNGGSSQILDAKIIVGASGNSAAAIYNTGGATPKIQNSSMLANGFPKYDVYNTGGAGPTILNSSLEDVSGTTSIFNDSGTVKVAGSQIAGTVSGPGISCLYSYKPDLTPLGLACI